MARAVLDPSSSDREALRKRSEAQRLDAESRQHKTAEARERRRALEKRQNAERIAEECRRLGIRVNFHNPSQTAREVTDEPSSAQGTDS